MGNNKPKTSKSVSSKQRNVRVNVERMKNHEMSPAKPKSTKPRPQKVSKAAAELIEQKTKAKAEKKLRVVLYKQKRLEKTKVISKKTSRGQPLMKNRIEYLLKQIQESKKN